MSGRAVAALAVLAAVAAAVAGWLVVRAGLGDGGTTVPEGPLFAALAARPEAAVRVRVVTGPYRLLAEREGDAWVAPAKGGYPVASDVVQALVAGLAGLRPLERKTRDPARYPLVEVEAVDAPDARSRLVTVEGAGGEVLAEALIGRRSGTLGAGAGGALFVRRPDEAQTWLAAGTVPLPASASEWFVREIVHVPAPEVRSVAVLEGGAPVFQAAKPRPGAPYEAVGPRARGAAVDDSATKAVAQAIVSMTFEDVRPAAEIEVPDDARSVRFETFGGLIVEVTLGVAGEEAWVLIAASAEPGGNAAAIARAVDARTAGWAFRLPPHKLTPLAVPVASLWGPPEDRRRP